ncbi:MAG: hypothetical protein JWN99_2121 [Ilumatobacteraceae bacterium]|nr:hypothetical protein [Ilumatobacteraceae bacterium]
MNDTFSTSADQADLESIVRRQLHALADHAPATVRAIDEITVQPFATAPRRHRRRAAGIGATIAAVAGAIGITTVALNGAGSGGGASPAEAVQQLVDAARHEDLLGMIDVIDPAEVPAVRAAAQQGQTEAQRSDLVSDQFDLNGIAGLDVSVVDLSLQTQQLADDLAIVSATSGTMTTHFDPTTFPFGRSLLDAVGAQSPSTTSADLGPDGVDARVATIERDGRWYVSISYTVAELARSAAHDSFPTDAPPASEGFDSADAAATAFFDRLAALDFEGMVATAAPGEGDALARYASLWLPTATDWGNRAHTSGYDLHVSGLTYATTGDGDRRTLQPTAFVIEGTVPASTGVTLDPTLPTAISLDSGQGWVMIPAGRSLPATIDGLTVVSGPDTNDYNFSTADVQGKVAQVPFASGDPDAPQALRVERADGCTTWSGPAASAMLASTSTDGFENIGDDSWRSCATSLFAPGLLSALGAGGATELPSVATVELDGQWYVSPLGTVAASVLDVLRSVPEGGSLFDSPLGTYVYGTNRAFMQLIYVGRPASQLADGCAALFVIDGSGTITAVIDDPPPALIRRCGNSLVSSGSATAAPQVAIEEAPPATSAG